MAVAPIGGVAMPNGPAVAVAPVMAPSVGVPAVVAGPVVGVAPAAVVAWAAEVGAVVAWPGCWSPPPLHAASNIENKAISAISFNLK